MIAVKSHGNRKVSIVEKEIPGMGPGDVLVRVKAAAICGSDLHGIYRKPGEHPFTPGHEMAGEVVEAGPGAGLEKGSRVCVPAAIGCGKCWLCRKGFTIYCGEAKVIGFSLDGGHAEFVAVPGCHCLSLPDDISFEAGALIADPVGALFHSYRKMGLSSLDTIVIFGLGPMGLGGTIVAKLFGARVIGVDVNDYRLNLAKTLGADHVLNPKRQDVKAEVLKLTGGAGPEKAVDCAGSEVTLGLALDLVRKLGTVAIIGENQKAVINPSDHFNRKELVMQGSTCFNLGEYNDIVSMIQRGLKPERIITHRFPLKDAVEAYRLFDGGDAGKVVFVDR